MDLVTFLDTSLTATPDNKNCKPQSPQVLGPILDQDEVIIGVVGLDGKSFGPLVPASGVGPSASIFTMGSSADIKPTDGKLSPEVPKFRINYLAPDQATSGADHPVVFFTTVNGAQAKEGCAKNQFEIDCVGLTSTTSVPFPGISVAPIQPCNNCLASSNSATAKNRYLVPGAPVPLQLIPVGGEGSWFPQTYPLPPAPSESGKFALALSNVPYTINAVVGGESYTDVSISTFFPFEAQDGAFLENTSPQQIYIIPTKYFSSNRGAELTAGASCPDCAANPDEGWGAFCSIACRPQFRAGSNQTPRGSSYDCDRGGSANSCFGSCKYGFTQLDECKDGCFYRYCKSGEPRCNGDCKSPCAPTGPFMVTDNVCVLKDGSYGCVIAKSVTGTNGDVLTSTEIAVIAIVSAVLLGIVIYVIYAWASEYNKASPG